jgi:hypothetical protein
MIFEGYKAKLAMTNNRSTKIQPNIDEDFSGVAQIIHYCATTPFTIPVERPSVAQ